MDEARIYDVLQCPLCAYFTGVSNHQWGLANARGALVNHLTRKKHHLNRAEANALAKLQFSTHARWNSERNGFDVLIEKATADDAVAGTD